MHPPNLVSSANKKINNSEILLEESSFQIFSLPADLGNEEL